MCVCLCVSVCVCACVCTYVCAVHQCALHRLWLVCFIWIVYGLNKLRCGWLDEPHMSECCKHCSNQGTTATPTHTHTRTRTHARTHCPSVATIGTSKGALIYATATLSHTHTHTHTHTLARTIRVLQPLVHPRCVHVPPPHHTHTHHNVSTPRRVLIRTSTHQHTTCTHTHTHTNAPRYTYRLHT
ncbi:hypothetical protein ES703_120084 [subsurface metagenome]